MTSECRSCGSPIWWATSTGGRRMPIDIEPCEDGNLVVVDERGEVLPEEATDLAIQNGQARVTAARRGPRMMDPEHRRWKSHFATCPEAGRFRRSSS